MQIEVKETEPCKLTIHYVADAEAILNARAKVIEAFKKAPVPGFRPGKASLDAIKIHYRDQIEESLKRAMAEDAYHNTLFEKKLKPHGAPRFNNLMMADGKFTCDFDLFVKPNFELSPYRTMDIPKPHDPQDSDVMAEAMLQELRVRFGDVLPYTETDFVQAGDNVILDYEGFLDGQKIPGLSAAGEMLTVGKSHLPAFDDNLLGMKMGETREFDMLVPEGGLPSLAGKTVHLKVTVNMGSKTLPCALDDTLAQRLGKKDYTELREYIYGMAVAKTSHGFQMAVNEAVARRLLADNTIAVPPWLSLSEAQYLVHQAKLDWNTLVDEDKEKYLNIGEQNVKLALILDKVREAEPEAQLTDQEVFEIVKQNLSRTKTQNNLDDVIKEMNRTGYLQILFSRIRDEHTLDYIVKSARIIE
jgi:trigger factor